MIRGINVNIHDLLKKSIELGASDIHITINIFLSDTSYNIY